MISALRPKSIHRFYSLTNKTTPRSLASPPFTKKWAMMKTHAKPWQKFPKRGQKSPAYKSLEAALKLEDEAAAVGDATKLEAELANDPENHQLRFDLALAYNAQGEKLKAAEQLMHIIKTDREWNDDGARTKLLELFDAWGPADPDTARARRMLSGLLFS